MPYSQPLYSVGVVELQTELGYINMSKSSKLAFYLLRTIEIAKNRVYDLTLLIRADPNSAIFFMVIKGFRKVIPTSKLGNFSLR